MKLTRVPHRTRGQHNVPVHCRNRYRERVMYSYNAVINFLVARRCRGVITWVSHHLQICQHVRYLPLIWVLRHSRRNKSDSASEVQRLIGSFLNNSCIPAVLGLELLQSHFIMRPCNIVCVCRQTASSAADHAEHNKTGGHRS